MVDITVPQGIERQESHGCNDNNNMVTPDTEANETVEQKMNRILNSPFTETEIMQTIKTIKTFDQVFDRHLPKKWEKTILYIC